MLFLFESFEVKTWYLLKMPSLYGKMNLAMSPVNFHAAVSDTDLAWVTQVKKQHLKAFKVKAFNLCLEFMPKAFNLCLDLVPLS